jgi:hypothetical protein
MASIEIVRNNILNNEYGSYKEKLLKVLQNNKERLNIPETKIDTLSIDLQKLGYVNLLINSFSTKEAMKKDGFLKKLTNEINNVTGFNISKLETYELMKESILVKTEYNKLKQNKELQNNMIVMSGGFFNWDEETTLTTKALDVLSLMLDIAGIVPAAGIAIDGLNILINLVRKKWVMAGLGLISIVPILGTAGPAIKVFAQVMSNKVGNKEVEAAEEEEEEESGDGDEEGDY